MDNETDAKTSGHAELERHAITVITKYFEYNSNVDSKSSDVESLCHLMTSNVKVDYPSFETQGDSDKDLEKYKAHVTNSLGIADKISKHQVYATNSNHDQYKFEHLSDNNYNDGSIIAVEIEWTYEMEWINCIGCMFKYICCCVPSVYKTYGINKYRLKYDSNNQLKICYVQTRQTK